MKNSCKTHGNPRIWQSFRLPLPKKTRINLYQLQQIVNNEKTFTTHPTTENNNAFSHIAINFELKGKQSFNVYSNGKIRANYSLSTKAMSHLLDFFYYTLVIECFTEEQ